LFCHAKKEVNASRLLLHISTFVDHMLLGLNASLFQLAELPWHKTDSATQQNATRVEEMIAAATALNVQAQSLVGTVTIFKLRQV